MSSQKNYAFFSADEQDRNKATYTFKIPRNSAITHRVITYFKIHSVAIKVLTYLQGEVNKFLFENSNCINPQEQKDSKVKRQNNTLLTLLLNKERFKRTIFFSHYI
jgi:hypothetical protein